MEPMGYELATQQDKKDRVVDEISFPEPSRFLAEAIQPFQTKFHHPAGGLLDLTTQEAKGCSNADRACVECRRLLLLGLGDETVAHSCRLSIA